MKWPWTKNEVVPTETKGADLDSFLRQLAEANVTVSGISVTPDNCMKSPTVHGIVTAVQNRLATSPIKVMRKTQKNGRDYKEPLPSHPVTRLLHHPNQWQTAEDYIADATSTLMRYGRFFAFKSRGQTGPIRELIPVDAAQMEVRMDQDLWRVSYRYKGTKNYTFDQVHYARLGSRNFYEGDSPIDDIRESIALEIAAEQFGNSFFGNGAMPFVYFSLMDGFRDFQSEQEKMNFLQSVKQAFGGAKRFNTMLMPKGMTMDALKIENDKAQFIETRKFIRTVIAGAFGVPPHLVGDLERATFNNVEQQDTDFTLNVVLPIAKRLEASMERDLLTDQDRRAGVVIRFNLDSTQRADIKTRNESLRVAREWGAINANEWREHLNLNPLSEEDGGEEYIRPMNMQSMDEAEGSMLPATVPPPQEEERAITQPLDLTIAMPQAKYHFDVNPQFEISLNVEGTDIEIAETTINVEQPEVNVKAEIAQPEINIGPTHVNVAQPQMEFNLDPEINVNVDQPSINVEQPELSMGDTYVNTPDVVVNNASDVNVEQPEINLGDTYVTTPDVVVHSAPEIRVEQPEIALGDTYVTTPDVVVHNAPEITVEQPEVSLGDTYVTTPDVVVNNSAPDITVEQPDITMGDTYVNTPDIEVHNAPIDIKVEQPDIKLGDTYVETPEVQVVNNPPDVLVENNYEIPVNIENTVESADILVEPPNVTIQPADIKVDVEAPFVKVDVDMPEYETIETEPVRDKDGRIVKTITNKKRTSEPKSKVEVQKSEAQKSMDAKKTRDAQKNRKKK